MKKSLRALCLATTSLVIAGGTAAQAMEGVVASIKPVHSLVAGVMQGVGEPTLIVGGAGSPHTYALRPSEARALENASLVFWVGEGMETFLTRPLETLTGSATVVELSQANGLTELEYRTGGPFEAHAHDDHEGHDHGRGHDHSDDNEEAHAHADHEDEDAGHDHSPHGHDHGHEEAAHDHGSDDHAGHDHSHEGIDMHLWLDPLNAKAFVARIEQALSQADPDNAQTYRTNAEALAARLDALVTQTEAALEPVRERGFVVFHDAYHYFENRFGLAAAGSITVSPEVIPGAQRVAEIQARVRELGATCVFAEPQFEPRLISVVTEGTDARAGVLDPLGAELEDGPELYFELIGNLTTSLTECLGGES